MSDTTAIDATLLPREEIIRLARIAVEQLDFASAKPGRTPVDPPFCELGTLRNGIAVDGPLAGRVFAVPQAMRPGHVHVLRAGEREPGHDYRLLAEHSRWGQEFRCWSYLGPTIPGATPRGAAKETLHSLRQPFCGRRATHSVAPQRVDLVCDSCHDSYSTSYPPQTPHAETAVEDWATNHFLLTGHHGFEYRAVDRWTFHARPDTRLRP